VIETAEARELWPCTRHGRWMASEYKLGLVSVIVPTYNRAHLVIKAMDSVWQQTYRSIELIVVDDGSTDDTQETIDQWSKTHGNDSDFQTVYLRQDNSGAPAARNLGLIESRGEFIQFLDSDDALSPTKLEHQVACLSHGQLDFTYCKVEYRDEDQRLVGVAGSDMAEGNAAYVTSHLWKILAPLYRRNCCLSVGPWNEQLRACEPYEYAARLKGMGFIASFEDTVYATVLKQTLGSVSTQQPLIMAQANEQASRAVLRTVEASDVATDADYDALATSFICTSHEFARLGDKGRAKACMVEARQLARSPVLRLQLLATSVASPLFGLRAIYSGVSRMRGVARLLSRART
jgi:hypothetical protein